MRFPLSFLAIAMFAVIALASCGDDAAPGNAADSEQGISVGLEEELRIGGLEGAEEYTFGSVSTLAPSPDGSVYVADGQVPVVRKYDAEGRHLLDVGRGGEGPGEYLAVDGLGVLPGGTLVLWDGRNHRLSYYDPEGAFERSVQVPAGLGGWRAFLLSPDGDVFLRVAPEEGFVEGPGGIRSDWARIRSEGAVERIAPVPPEDRVGPRYVLAGRGGYYRPFVTMTLSAVAPDGSVYSMRNDEYRIRRTHPDGRETAITRDEPPVEVSAEERREWEARSESFARRTPENRSDYFPIPDVKPYVRELVVDPEGRLWVSRYTEVAFMEYSPEELAERREQNLPSYQWRDLLRWDVFGPDDAYLGSVTFPFKTSFVTAVGDAVWGVQGGDFREDYVVRWRMVRP